MWAVAALATAVLAGCSSDNSSSKSDTSSPTANTQDAYCQQVQAFKTASNSLSSVFNGNVAPTPDAVKAVFTTMQDGLHALDKNPPAAIKSDIDVMTKDIDAIVAIFTKHGWDVNEVSSGPDSEALQASLNDPAAETASANLKTWAAGACGITTDSVAP